MQLEITGFLEGNASVFMEELWTLLLDAQRNPTGIPTVFLEKKKQELLARQVSCGSEWEAATRSTNFGSLAVGVFARQHG